MRPLNQPTKEPAKSRVLILHHKYGHNTYANDIGRSVAADFDVQLLSLFPPTATLPDSTSPHDPAFHSLDAANVWTACRRFREYCHVYRPDLVHTNSLVSGFVGRAVSRMAGVRNLVTTEHSLHSKPGYRFKHAAMNASTLPLARAVVFVSESARLAMPSWERQLLPDSKCHVIHNGVDVERIHRYRWKASEVRPRYGFAPEDLLLLHVAKLEPEKNLSLILRAMTVIVNHEPHAKLLVLGEGSQMPAIARSIHHLGLGNSVVLAGQVTRSEVYAALFAADLFVLPSRWETLGVAALEAMAAGLPVILSDIPAFQELIRDGSSGRLISIRKCDQLTEAVLELSRDRRAADALATVAKSIVDNKFSLAAMGAKYAALFRSIVAQPPS